MFLRTSRHRAADLTHAPARRSRRRTGLTTLAVLATTAGLPLIAHNPHVSAAGLELSFSIHTDATAPPITGSLTPLVPKRVSIDADPAKEIEVSIELSGDPDRPFRFRADLLRRVAPVPLRVELTADDGSAATTFGYDALGSLAPRKFSVDGGSSSGGSGTDVHLAAKVSGAAASLVLLGNQDQRHDPATPADDVAATSAVQLSPVPARVSADVHIDHANTPRSEPSAISYKASAPVAEIRARFRQLTGTSVVDDAILRATGVPETVDVSSAHETLTLTASAPVGSIEAGFARNRGVATLVAPGHYVHAIGNGPARSVAAKLLGLESATVNTAEPFGLEASFQSAAPLHVLLQELVQLPGNPAPTTAAQLDANVSDVPSTVDLEIGVVDGRLTYAGSAPIDAIELDASALIPLGGTPATAVEATIESIPADLTFDFGQLSSGLGVEAGAGQSIGLVDVLLRNVVPTSGERLAAGAQGVLLTDQSGRFVVHGRIAGLRLARVSDSNIATPTVNRTTRTVRLKTDPAVPEHNFKVLVDRAAGPDVNASIQALPDDVTATLTIERFPATPTLTKFAKLKWLASETAGAVTGTVSGGGIKHAKITASPMHRDSEACIGFTPSSCSGNFSLTQGNSFSLRSSGATDLDVFACLAGTGACTEASGTATQFVDIDDLELTPAGTAVPAKFAVGIGGAKVNAEDLSVAVDTDNATVESNGIAKVAFDGKVRQLDWVLDSVEAQNRLVFMKKELFGLRVIAASGTMTCGSATDVQIKNFLGALGAGQLRQELCTNI